jgi:TPR repeat protein
MILMSKRYPESFKAALESEGDLNGFFDAVNTVRKNVLDGVAKFTKLSEAGSTLSMYMLGDIYFWSYKDLRQGDLGMKWLKQASDRGSIEAAYQIGRAKKSMNDLDAAVSVFSNLSERGFSPAMFQLGMIYLAQNSLSMCERFYTMGSNSGNFPARQNLSVLMSRGKFGASKIGVGIKIWASMIGEYQSLLKSYPESDRFRGGGGKIKGSQIDSITRASLLLIG